MKMNNGNSNESMKIINESVSKYRRKLAIVSKSISGNAMYCVPASLSARCALQHSSWRSITGVSAKWRSVNNGVA
jgi:hypothetical protein